VLYYKTLEVKDNISLLDITLETGRTHQIRVQLADRGFPILGDKRYGSPYDFSQMALFSYRLEGISPTDGKSFVFSDMPFGDAFEYFKNKNA
jgi:23S rRNA-/tRNA-specific pseudouridylate synthase